MTRRHPISTLFPYTTLFRSAPSPCTDRRSPLGDLEPPARTEPARAEPVHARSEEHTSELQSPYDLVCRLLLEKKKAYLKKRNERVTDPSTQSYDLPNCAPLK